MLLLLEYVFGVISYFRLPTKMLLSVVIHARLKNRIVMTRRLKRVFCGICIVCLREAASYGF